MNLSLCLVAVAVLFLQLAVQCSAEAKLQIGIKKRVENCPIKSRKGDLVHMHYTVSALSIFNYKII